MLNRALYLFLVMIWATQMLAQDGHNITLKVSSIKDTTGLLAFHYGKQKLIEDTLYFDANGVATVKGNQPLPRGIYLMVSPSQDFFEFIVADDQQFTLTTTGPNYVENMQVEGSEENRIFIEDLQFVVAQRKQYENLQNRLTALEASGSDSVSIIKQALAEIDGAVQNYRTQLIAAHPSLFYTKFLSSLKDPEIKDPIDPVTGEIDSTYPYRYYKAHYFDNMDFSEPGMMRTPTFEGKLKTYIEQLTAQHPDSVIIAADYLIEKAQANREVFKFTLAWLLNKYAKRELMGFDAVYVHLAEKYYLSGVADWVDKNQLKRIREDALTMKPLLLGKIAPNITAKTPTGETLSLYDMDDYDFLLLWIWDADCGHCRKETPKLHKKYQTWKDQYNLKVFAITTELTRDRWDAFLEEHQLYDWNNLIDVEGRDNFRDAYDVKGTPSVYILDKNFTIIGKRLSVEQMGDFFKFEADKLKQQ